LFKFKPQTESSYKSGQNSKVVIFAPPDKIKGGSPRWRSAYRTSTYTTYIHNLFVDFHSHVSDISFLEMKSVHWHCKILVFFAAW